MNFQGFAITFCRIIWVSFGFMEFSKNRMAVTRDPPGDTSYRPSFLGFLHQPPGDREWSARRRELGCAVFCCFGYFWVTCEVAVILICF